MADPMFSNKRGGAGMDPATYDPDGDLKVTPEEHSHAINDVTGLQTALNEKASATHNHDGTYAPASHTHLTAEVTGLDTALASKLTASQSAAVADSVAAPDVGTLETKVNELLAALRAAGIMAP